MLLTLMLLYEQSGSVQKDPHGLHQSWKNVCMNEISWSWKQYVQRTHRIGVTLNDFATKLTVRSRSQRNLNYKQSFTENKNDSRHTWQTINQLTSRPRSRPFKSQLNRKVHYESKQACMMNLKSSKHPRSFFPQKKPILPYLTKASQHPLLKVEF